MKPSKSVILLLLLTFGACKHPGPTVYTGSKIDTALNCINHQLTTYTYDDEGNIATIQISQGNRTVFTFSGDSLVEDIFNGAGVLIAGYVYYINNQVADSGHGIGQYAHQTYSYSYDDNYMLTQILEYGSGILDSTITYSNGNKNIIDIEAQAASNNTHFFDYFTYYLSNGNTLGNQAIGENYLGTQTNNLIQTDVKIDNNGDTTDIIRYRYRYDTSGRPDTVSTYSDYGSNHGELLDSFIYTYY